MPMSGPQAAAPASGPSRSPGSNARTEEQKAGAPSQLAFMRPTAPLPGGGPPLTLPPQMRTPWGHSGITPAPSLVQRPGSPTNTLGRLPGGRVLLFLVLTVSVLFVAGTVGQCGVGQVYLDGEDIGITQHRIAVIVVLGHGGHEALQLKYDVLDWGVKGTLLDGARSFPCSPRGHPCLGMDG